VLLLSLLTFLVLLFSGRALAYSLPRQTAVEAIATATIHTHAWLQA
jgi:hypothetical protein